MPIFESATVITRRIRRSTDGGATWNTMNEGLGAAGPGGGVFRLAANGSRWESVNFGLTLIPRVGFRPGAVRPLALAFTPAGVAFVATESHGLFRRPPDPRGER